MTHLLPMSIVAAVVYVIVAGLSLHFLARFPWLNCVREVRPRQCGQHLLSYGVLLAYLLLHAWTHHDSTFFHDELIFVVPSLKQQSTSSAAGALSWSKELLLKVAEATTEAFLRPWTQLARLTHSSPSPSLSSPSAEEALPSLMKVLLFSSFDALMQATAATCLFGTFAVLCNARWRYAALHSAEKHADLWATLFPMGPAEAAASVLGIDAHARVPQRPLDLSADSLTWSTQMPPLSTPIPRRTAPRRAARMSTLNTSVRAQSRRVRTPTRSQLSLPRFNNSSSSATSANASARLTGSAAAPSPYADEAARSTTEEQQQQQQQWRHLLRLRQRFLSAFWLTDTMVLLVTFSLFSSLAVSRVAVTLAVSAVWSAHARTDAVRWTALTPSPAEGYVALMGVCYLAVLHRRLRRQSTYLRELLHLLGSSAATTARSPASPTTATPIPSLPLPRERPARLMHNVGATGARTGYRSGLRRRSPGSGQASSPLSPITPTDLLYKPGFDDATLSGMVTPSPQAPTRATLRAASLENTPSAVFYLNPDDRAAGAAGATTDSSAASSITVEAPLPSLLARWSFRMLRTSCSRESSQSGQTPALSRSSSTAAGAMSNATTTASTATTPAAAAVPELLPPSIPHFRYPLLVSAALLALQFFPDATSVWAVAVFTVAAAAIGTAQENLLGPLRWVAMDYRALLQCSWWTLFLSRAFTPRSMDVSKAVRGLSHQQRRHLMVLQAFGSHHTHPSSTVEEDDDWVTEEANGSFAANALVAAATTMPSASAARGGSVKSTTMTPELATSPQTADSSSGTVNLSTSSAATAVAILGGASDMNVGGFLAAYDDPTSLANHSSPMNANDDEDDEDDDLTMADDSGVSGGDSAGVMAIPPAQFWHGVAAKVLKQSAAHATGHDGATDGTGGGMTGSFAGPASTTLTGSFAGLPPLPGIGAGMMHVTNGSLGEAATIANTSFLGVADPFRVAAAPAMVSATAASSASVIATALMPITPGMELGGTHLPGFNAHAMKGSMLRSAPAVARVGAAAEKEEEEARWREAEEERRRREEEEEEEEAAALAANAEKARKEVVDNDDEQGEREGDFGVSVGSRRGSRRFFAETPETAGSCASQSLDHHHDDDDKDPSVSDGWWSRALATVVPGIVGHRSSTSSHMSSHRSSCSVTPSSHAEAAASELPAEVVHNFSFAGSFSGATSVTGRALLQSEEGFARFLSRVRRDGDNTYALQNMLSSHGHTYAHRVDAKGRSALHYAVIGGFVHGVWFLVNIGAEPNLLDKAGYAPLHYAVLYHTEHCLSPTITDENGSLAVQEPKHMLGIPVVGTASVQAPEQARKRRQLRQQRHRRSMEERMQAAYATSSTTSETSYLDSSHDADLAAEDRSNHSGSTYENNAHRTPLGVPGEALDRSGPLLHMLPTSTPGDSEETTVEEPTSGMAVVVAAAAVAMAQEERGQWYGMVGRLLSLGALVDFPTARGLTALHLAVLQGTIGLINTLLREGANPLLGSELETQSFLAAANAAPWDEDAADAKKEVCRDGEAEEEEEKDSAAAWIAQIHSEFQRLGVRQRRRREQEQGQEQQRQKDEGEEPQRAQQQHGVGDRQDKGDVGPSAKQTTKRAGGGGGGSGEQPARGTGSPRSGSSSCSGTSNATTANTTAALVRKALLEKQTEWVDVHITNAGNPIAMGYCKSPLLLAVELDADLAVASMLHHATLQATSARFVAGLPGSRLGSGSGTEAPFSHSQVGGSGLQLMSSNGTSHLPASPMPSMATRESPPASSASLLAAAGEAGNDRPMQRPPLAPSGSSTSPVLTSSGVRSISANSKDVSFTAAYACSAPHSTLPGNANPLVDQVNATHVSFSEEVAAEPPAAMTGLLPLPSAITAAETNINNSSVAELLHSSAGATVDTIATTITTLASAWARTCWERPCPHGFNAIHVALVLGNAQVVRVLLLRWTYNGVERGGALPPPSVERATSMMASGNDVDVSSTSAGVGNGGGNSRTLSRPTDASASTIAKAMAAPVTNTTGINMSPLQPTVAQITVPVHDDGENMTFVKSEGSTTEAGAEQEGASPLEADGPASGSRQSTASLHASHHHHHHHHHHPHAHDPTTATLSLTTSIGVSAFWVVPLRLNFFHLAAIGDSTECLAYVLRWRGVPDYVPCALDDAFHDEAKAEDTRQDMNVTLSATAAQDAYHRRRTHHRQQKRLGNHHNTREPAGMASILRSSAASPNTAQPMQLTDALHAVQQQMERLSTTTTTTTMTAAAANSNSSNNNNSADLEKKRTHQSEERGRRAANSSFPESPSSSSCSSKASTKQASEAASAAPTLRPAVSDVALPSEHRESVNPPLKEVVTVLPAPPSFASFSSSTQTAEFAGGAARDLETAMGSSATSDLFNRTWSSGRPSLDTGSSGTAPRLSRTHLMPPVPALSRRAHRLRTKQHTFMRALVTLLQTNIRGDAVRRRVRKTVFGRGGAGAVLQPLTGTTKRASTGEGDTIAAGRGGEPDGGANAATAASAALSGNQNSVMAQTCFGSTAAAAALHTGMTICYATMNNLLHEEPLGEVADDDDSSSRSSSSSSSTNESSSINTNNCAEEAKARATGEAAKPHALRLPDLVQERLRKRRRQMQLLQLREQERLHHLRQQRRRAFVSAVAKLRQSIVGVPIDIAHLAAVEMAVDRACAALPTAKARRTLQQALLIVTRRLQNQNRRQQLVHGLRQGAAAVASAASTAPGSRRSSGVTRASRRESDAADGRTGDDLFSTTTTTTTTTDSRALSSTRSTPKAQKGLRRRSSAVRRPFNDTDSGGSQATSPQQRALQQQPSMATSTPSYYSAFDRYQEKEAFENEEGDDDGASSADLRWEGYRRFQQQQRLLQLLGALAIELNAVDTRGLTPLHYAIANQNASMVYLLCAYGATFVFASPQTEEHLVGHPVEAVAAAAVAEYESGGDGGGGGSATPATSVSDAGNTRPTTTLSALTVSPTTSTFTMTSAGTRGIARDRNGVSVWQPGNASEATSSMVSSSLFSASASPTSLAAVRAQLTAPGISVATDVLAFYSEHYFAQLTPSTQEALRRAAKTGSAEYLLLRLPTRVEQDAEQQTLSLDGVRHAATLPIAASGAVAASLQADISTSGPNGFVQHQLASTVQLPLHPPLPPMAPPSVTVPASAAGALPSPPSSCSSVSSPPSQLQQQPQQQHWPPSLKQSFAQPTTMAATLTEALGLGVNGSFTAAAAGALGALSEGNSDARDIARTTASTPREEKERDVVGGEEGLHGLQAQLLDQEGKALQRMVGGGGEVPSSGAEHHGFANNNSIAIPLPSPVLSAMEGAECSKGCSTAVSEVGKTSSMAASSWRQQGSTVTAGAEPTHSVERASNSAGSPASASLRAPSAPRTLQTYPTNTSAASSSTNTGAAADTIHEAKINADYALLEPHDVFLTHMVRNPTKADSIVRAAMEGTALRYLFQASIATSVLET